jgi:hypothetical protein
MLHDEHGNVIEDYIASGWDPVPFGFAGGIYDRDTGLVCPILVSPAQVHRVV